MGFFRSSVLRMLYLLYRAKHPYSLVVVLGTQHCCVPLIDKKNSGDSLQERIAITMRDLNDERPRPMLNGNTSAEVFLQKKTRLPNRRRFNMEVTTKQLELEALAGSRTEKNAARRNAVIHVFSHYNLINWRGNGSTNSNSQTGTDQIAATKNGRRPTPTKSAKLAPKGGRLGPRGAFYLNYVTKANWKGPMNRNLSVITTVPSIAIFNFIWTGIGFVTANTDGIVPVD